MIAVDLVVALLLVGSGMLVLTAAAGLWRLPDFPSRMHAPALANTLGTWCVALASVVHLTAATGQLALHHWTIMMLLSIAAPVTTALLARANLFRVRTSAPPPH